MKTLAYAIRRLDYPSLALLVEKYPESLTTHNVSDGMSLAHLAVATGMRDMVDFIYELGATMSGFGQHRYAEAKPIHLAALMLNTDLIELLMQWETEYDLFVACSRGDISYIEKLLKKNPAIVQKKGPFGANLLHFANNPLVAELLLSYGAHIDSPDSWHSSTPSQWAIENRGDLARYLIQHGAKPDPFLFLALNSLEAMQREVEGFGESAAKHVPKIYRQKSEYQQGKHIYEHIFGSGCTLINAAAQLGITSALPFLTSKGLKPDRGYGEENMSALHSAVLHNRLNVLQALIPYCSDINPVCVGRFHTTPLGLATLLGNVDAVSILLHAGATIEPYFLLEAHNGIEGAYANICQTDAEKYRQVEAMLCQSKIQTL